MTSILLCVGIYSVLTKHMDDCVAWCGLPSFDPMGNEIFLSAR